VRLWKPNEESVFIFDESHKHRLFFVVSRIFICDYVMLNLSLVDMEVCDRTLDKKKSTQNATSKFKLKWRFFLFKLTFSIGSSSSA